MEFDKTYVKYDLNNKINVKRQFSQSIKILL